MTFVCLHNIDMVCTSDKLTTENLDESEEFGS